MLKLKLNRCSSTHWDWNSKQACSAYFGMFSGMSDTGCQRHQRLNNVNYYNLCLLCGCSISLNRRAISSPLIIYMVIHRSQSLFNEFTFFYATGIDLNLVNKQECVTENMTYWLGENFSLWLVSSKFFPYSPEFIILHYCFHYVTEVAFE